MPLRHLHQRIGLVVAVLAVVMAACGGSVADGPLSQGRSVYGSSCSACHGSSGNGGVGPSFAGVVETFPSCDEHIKWVTLGSERWKAEVGDTYGATNKPIEQIMPEMGLQLSPEEIAAVAAYERIQYGGADETSTLTECGLEPGVNP